MADYSVRPARAADAGAIWQIQQQALLQDIAAACGGVCPPAAREAIDQTPGARSWEDTITAAQPNSAVLVALRADRVVGYGALTALPEPAKTPDGHGSIDAEITALDVRAADQRCGHGSRLLAALMDSAREFCVRGVCTWVIAGEESRTRFLTTAGFAPLGVKRTLDVGDGDLTQLGWYTLLP